VGSIPGRPCQQFFNPGLHKKYQQGTLSVRVIVICGDHKLLWRTLGHASTSPESILHKIIIIIVVWNDLPNFKLFVPENDDVFLTLKLFGIRLLKFLEAW